MSGTILIVSVTQSRHVWAPAIRFAKGNSRARGTGSDFYAAGRGMICPPSEFSLPGHKRIMTDGNSKGMHNKHKTRPYARHGECITHRAATHIPAEMEGFRTHV